MTVEERHIHEDRPHNGVLQVLTVAALVLALAALAFVQVNMRHEQERTNRTIADLQEKSQARIDAVEQRAAALEQENSSLHALDATTKKAIQDTQRRLTLTRTAAEKKIDAEIAKVNDQSAKQLSDLQQAQDAKFGSINGDMVAVKSNLDSTKTNLDGVSSKLEKTIGDLGEQSGLVARNHDELAELRRKGERDYAEFDLKKTKDFSRFSDVSLKLLKTDAGKQRYTVSVMVADKRLEKRDKTALEPVQLYMPGGHKLVEIVVWDVNKDRVTGYISSPKS